jgi:hypothetical protein
VGSKISGVYSEILKKEEASMGPLRAFRRPFFRTRLDMTIEVVGF